MSRGLCAPPSAASRRRRTLHSSDTISATQTVGVTATSPVTGSSATAIINLTPGAAANFVTSDTNTEGSWQGVYGADGYSIANLSNQSIPSYVSNFTVQNPASFTWSATTGDARALQIPGSSNGTAATWYSASGFNINVNFADGNIHPFELYALDWDARGRAETVRCSMRTPTLFWTPVIFPTSRAGFICSGTSREV